MSLLMIAMAIVGASTETSDTNGGPVRHAVEQALAKSASGWNNRDLNAYMEIYASGGDALYVAGGAIVRGHQAIKEVYKPRFNAPDMGNLSFAIISFESLSQDCASVVGRYKLQMQDGAVHSGIATLVLRRASGKWRVILDHSG